MAKFIRSSRRHILLGLGGTAVSLPFLPSLWPKALHAAPATTNERCFAAFQIGHGGYWAEDMVGEQLGPIDAPPASLTRELWLSGGRDSGSGNDFPDHYIHHGDLTNYVQTASAAGESADPDGGAPRLSYALGSRATPLLPKMNILRGICLPVKSFGHQSRVTLGQFGSSQNGPDYPNTASVDYVMSESSSFYPNLGGVSRRALRVGTMSTDRMGRSVTEFHAGDTRTTELFDAVFGTADSSGEPERDLLVDSVLADYQRFMSPASSTGSRISSEDRVTVEQSVEHLFELQRRSRVSVSCGDLTRPDNIWRYPGYPAETYFPIITDIISLAFACGASRVGTFGFDGRWIGRDDCGCSDYHQDIAHQLANRNNARVHRSGLRTFYQQLLLPLAEKLDQYPGSQPGTTKLDDSLLAVTPESGFDTHRFKDDTIVTFGGACGTLNTGKYIDYRNLQNQAYGGDGRRPYPGALRNTFLSTTLEAMGIPRSEWQDEGRYGTKAYGGFLVDNTSRNHGQVSHSTNPGAHADQIHLPIWWRG
ncbi:MAG: DUF1552 domain-containing protein [Myxococcota bacterium]